MAELDEQRRLPILCLPVRIDPSKAGIVYSDPAQSRPDYRIRLSGITPETMASLSSY